ncbi:carboxylesterase/lipase family protein [Quadrisphaera sp. DSM 44207]|uniref:carboxylesterase/lipase family protein n=1 Tax=Quadrisphaera sp. DSM 44207 TaxID=1881057 RepID=UPI000882D6D7|nr:carboxylesterase family protein [Quadrisphaera sp. DSM 44207]SDQ86445.1 para-nitrobenzyl esterase [Quadrisphaera sp. DSM 44207]
MGRTPIDVALSSGIVRGRSTNGVATFLGVPYAAPPVGALRFAEPRPVPAWSGVREALEPGPSAPQRASTSLASLDVFPVSGARWRRGDDFLTLNVWAPTGSRSRPVVVYVHGGGLVLGTKDAPAYDGTAFARDGVVAVGLNYRLGVEGFLPIPGAPTNLGLRDTIAAFTWVQDDIAAFGGDPANVTVFGESGGGIAVACLVTSPLTTELFRRAVIQSGHGSAVYSLHVARRTVAAVARVLGVPADVEGFGSADAERCVAALSRVSRPGRVDLRDEDGVDPSFGLGVVNPVVGDDVLPRHPLEALAAGAGADVDVLIGTTAQEANSWFAPTRLDLLPRWAARWLLGRVAPRSRALFAAYADHGPGGPGERGGEVLARVLTDMAFRWPSRQYAEAHQGRTHVYELDWRSPAAGGRLGAAHGVDLPFVFDTLHTTTGPRGLTGTAPPQDLADHVHGLWVSYATDGTLPWPEFDRDARGVYHLSARAIRREPIMPAAAFTPAAPHLQQV